MVMRQYLHVSEKYIDNKQSNFELDVNANP
jgi:hypothetical protein